MKEDCFFISPFGAFDIENGNSGFTAGTDIGFETGDNSSIFFTIQRSEDDIIENGVKAVANGSDVQVGWRVKW